MTGGSSHAHARAHAHDGSEGAGLNPFVEGWLDRLKGDGPVLDLGCGHGFWTNHMADRGMRVVGIEPEVDRVGEAAAAAKAPVAAGDGAYLAWAGLVVLAAYAPAALLAATLPHGLVWVWVAMTVVFMGARGVLLSWRARGEAWLVTRATPVR